MPNKTEKYYPLDTALKSSLINYRGKAIAEWKDIENIRLKKSADKRPPPGLLFSLNSVPAIVFSRTLVRFKSGLLFLRAWSRMIYAASIAIGALTGGYIIFNALNHGVHKQKKISNPAEQKIFHPAIPVSVASPPAVVRENPIPGKTSLVTAVVAHKPLTVRSVRDSGTRVKILYYKESLSMDKLEKELSNEKSDSINQ